MPAHIKIAICFQYLLISARQRQTSEIRQKAEWMSNEIIKSEEFIKVHHQSARLQSVNELYLEFYIQ